MLAPEPLSMASEAVSRDTASGQQSGENQAMLCYVAALRGESVARQSSANAELA